MEGITLNESALQALTDSKRPVFIYEWLTKLDGVLSSLAGKLVFIVLIKLYTFILSL